MRKPFAYCVVLSVLGLAACGGGGGGSISGSPDEPVTLDIIETSASLDVGETFQFHAVVDHASDTTITWTVNDVVGGNSTVGTMSLDGLYTAPLSVPSANPVVVKATSNADKTKSDSATVTLSPVFAILPASTTLEVGKTQQFTANRPVEENGWYVNNIQNGSEAVGTITPSGLYTAPAKLPSPPAVTVTAYLAANHSKSATASVTIATPGAVAITPMTTTIAAGATQQFSANMPVTWTVGGAAGTDPGTWGTIDNSGLYTAPPTPPWIGKVNIKATAESDSSKQANAVATVVFSNATLNGHYAFKYRAVDSGASPGDYDHLWAVGSLVADGKGGISSGRIDMVDLNRTSPGGFSGTFTGTYSIKADGRGAATITLQAADSPVLPLRWVMLSNTSARVIGFDDTGSGWGNIDKQDPTTFSAGLAGTYVFSVDGVGITDSGLSAHAGAGMFTAQGGAFTSGLMDTNTDGTVRPQRAITGTYSNIDPATGRGTWQISDPQTGETWSSVFYANSSASVVFCMAGVNTEVLGNATRQDSSAPYSNGSISGNVVFLSTGYANPGTGDIVSVSSAGLLTADGNGSFTAGIVDINGTPSLPAGGSYSIAADGHGTMDIVAGGGTNHLAVYMLSANQFVYVSLMDTVVSTGQVFPQAPATYDASLMHGSFALRVSGTYVAPMADVSAQLTADGIGNLTGTVDQNIGGILLSDAPVIGSYLISPSGRGEAVITMGVSTLTYATYFVSGRLAILIPINSGGPALLGVAYRQF